MSTNALPTYLTLDGGIGSELKLRVDFDNFDPLWTSSLNHTALDVVKSVHKDYLTSGADVITTNTYKPSVESLMRVLSVDRQAALREFRDSVRVCRQLRDDFWDTVRDNGRQKPVVVASVGTYGTFLKDGTDYAGKYIETTSIETMKSMFRDKTRALLEGDPEFVAFETIPATKEAQAICDLLKEFPGIKAWVVFACKDGSHVCHGEKFSDAVLTTLTSDAVVAVGVNCTPAQHVTSLLREIPDVIKQNKRIVVYPNSGRHFNNKLREWFGDADSRPLADYVTEWMDAGANWIGGCCHVGPDQISSVRREMDKWRRAREDGGI